MRREVARKAAHDYPLTPHPLSREREAAAFSIKSSGSPWAERGPTIPQPFHFATDARAPPHAETAPQPAAVPLVRRALLERLLEESELGAANEGAHAQDNTDAAWGALSRGINITQM